MSFLESTCNFNVISPINSLGYGVAGYNIIRGLTSAGHTVALYGIGSIQSEPEQNELLKACFDNSRMPDFGAPCIRIWHQHDMAEFVGGGKKIGFPIFELNTFTEQELHQLGNPDEWFVCSQWGKDILKKALEERYKWEDLDSRIHVIPLGVDRSIFREKFADRNETIFFNCGKWEVRKGHDVLVKAFNEAFTPEDKVELWMMCDNPFYTDEENFQWERLYKGSGLGDKIRSIPRHQTQKDVYNIMSQTDCGVFPARAEGWNLELLEMMSCGKHVIATNYSGHTEFCNKDNCKLVEVTEMEDAKDGKWFHGQGQWAHLGESQIDQLVEHMQAIHKLKQEDNLNVNQAGIDTAKKFSWSNTAKEIAQAVSE